MTNTCTFLDNTKEVFSGRNNFASIIKSYMVSRGSVWVERGSWWFDQPGSGGCEGAAEQAVDVECAGHPERAPCWRDRSCSLQRGGS